MCNNNSFKNKNCFKCKYSRIDYSNISCIKDDKANWVDCPYRCEKELNELNKQILSDILEDD